MDRGTGNKLGSQACFDRTQVAKKQTFVNAQKQNAGNGDYVVALHIAKVFGSCNTANHRDVRCAGAPQQRGQ